MLVNEFIQTLAQYPEQPLLFEFRPGETVKGGYHVTEIKNATFETIDCGNSLHSWTEVILQVWEPEGIQPGRAPMSTGKFLKIWGIVDSRIPLNQDAEIRIEYGDAQQLTSVYHVDSLHATDKGILVQMTPPRTLCKPRELLGTLQGFANESAGCCSNPNPRHESETAIPLVQVHAQAGCC